MDKWNQYKNALRDMLTKPTGTVDMEDGNGTIVTLPTFPQLQKDVTGLTDSLTGAVAQAGDLVNQSRVYADNSRASADASAVSADVAASHETAAEAARAAAEASSVAAGNSATSAGTQASNASASAAGAAASASTASTKASDAAASANAAQAQADNAGFSAAAADSSKTQAAASKDLAKQYANAPVNVQVEPGQYSALHWAEQARLIAAGALIYRGLWSAASGSMPASPKVGDFYLVSTAGTVEGKQYRTGDMVMYDGSQWDRIDNQQTVTSVAGMTGAVQLDVSNIGGLAAELAARAPLASPKFTGQSIAVTSGDPKKDLIVTTGDVVTVNYANGYNTGSFVWQFAGSAKMTLSKEGYLSAGGGHVPGAPLDVYTGAGRFMMRTQSGNNSLDSVAWDNSAYAPMNIASSGSLTHNGSTVWDAANFNPSSKLNTDTGVTLASGDRWLAVGNFNGVNSGLFIGGDGGLTITYNWAQNLTIASNGVRVNGYAVWHGGNLDPNNFVARYPAYAVADANAMTGTMATALVSSAANTPRGNWATVLQVAQAANTSRAFQLGHDWLGTAGFPLYYRANKGDTNSTWTAWRPLRVVFVQSNDPGTAAEEGDLWVW